MLPQILLTIRAVLKHKQIQLYSRFDYLLMNFEICFYRARASYIKCHPWTDSTNTSKSLTGFQHLHVIMSWMEHSAKSCVAALFKPTKNTSLRKKKRRKHRKQIVHVLVFAIGGRTRTFVFHQCLSSCLCKHPRSPCLSTCMYTR